MDLFVSLDLFLFLFFPQQSEFYSPSIPSDRGKKGKIVWLLLFAVVVVLIMQEKFFFLRKGNMPIRFHSKHNPNITSCHHHNQGRGKSGNLERELISFSAASPMGVRQLKAAARSSPKIVEISLAWHII